jgi:hypothetical protein
MLTPYRSAETANSRENTDFNAVFSAGRVVVEHVMGLLKGRWTSLKGIRLQVKSLSDLVRVNEWILSCLILHNIVQGRNDEWDEGEDEYIGVTGVGLVDAQGVTSSALGIVLREALKGEMIDQGII